MPLVLFVGLPASGKTTRAKQLLAHLQHHLFPQQSTTREDSKEPNSSPPSATSVLPAPSSLLPPSAPLSTQDDSKDSSINQLSTLSLTDPSPTHPSTTTATAPTPTTTTTTVASTTPTTNPNSASPFTTLQSSPKQLHTTTTSPTSSISDLILLNHDSLSLPRSTFYVSPHNEKAGRSAIRASVERHLTSSRILLVDYINDIKGFRYELWCRARELGTTYCVVYCDVARERCVEWNKQRPVEEQYCDTVSGTHYTHTQAYEGLDSIRLVLAMWQLTYVCAVVWIVLCSMADLLGRMEVPNGSKRWDEPLFTVREEDVLPVKQITQWILHGKQQAPGLATLPAQLEDISYLQTLERTVNTISQSLVDRQQRQLIQPGDSVHVEGSTVRLQLVRAVKYAELKRIQGQFVKIARLRPMHGEVAIATSFVAHLQNALNY